MSDMFDDVMVERKPKAPKREKTFDGLRIIEIEIVNDKKIECFYMTPNGGNVRIAGPTAQGKTTAASALFEALEKNSESTVQDVCLMSLQKTLDKSLSEISSVEKGHLGAAQEVGRVRESYRVRLRPFLRKSYKFKGK